MNYNKIEIIENTDNPLRKYFVVDNKVLEYLETEGKYIGEFLRFEIDHYNDTEIKENKTTIKELKEFLNTIYKPH